MSPDRPRISERISARISEHTAWVTLVMIVLCDPTAAALNRSSLAPLSAPLLCLPVVFSVAAGCIYRAALAGLVAGFTAFWISPGSAGMFALAAWPALSVIGALGTRSVRQTRDAATQRLADVDSFLNANLWVSNSTSLEDAVDVVLLAVRQITSYDSAVLFMNDGAGNLRPQGAMAPQAEGRPQIALLDISNSVGSQALESPLYVTDIRNEPSHPFTNLIPGVQSFLSIPLFLSRHRMAGVLFVGFSGTHAITPAVKQRLKEFMDRISQALLLQGMAYADAMTGLQNYRAFRVTLEDEVRRSLRYRRPLSLLMVDIDDFKSVNDRHGHVGGDKALQHVASTLRHNLRETDMPARYGGEEFAIVCPETLSDDAVVVAERLRKAVEDRPCPIPGQADCYLTVSIGIATMPADGGTDAVLLELADAALYRAKQLGKNRTAGGTQPAGGPAKSASSTDAAPGVSPL